MLTQCTTHLEYSLGACHPSEVNCRCDQVVLVRDGAPQKGTQHPKIAALITAFQTQEAVFKPNTTLWLEHCRTNSPSSSASS